MARSKKSKPAATHPAPAPKTVTKPTSWWENTRLLQWGLFALGFVLYANTLGHQYALDDAIVIYDNEFTTQGISGIDDILKYDTFRGFSRWKERISWYPAGVIAPFHSSFLPSKWNCSGKVHWSGIW
ncbi:MAG: hypothetical protein IPL49_03090 [Saprospirales bacterium]|nr:hypothetical protein [Saprospirales bacterium]